MTATHRPTRLHIDYSIIEANARLLRAAYSGVQMIAVVKADAYGHGAVQTARAVLRAGADRLAVAMADEAVELREAGVTAPILILGGAQGEAAEEAVRCGAAVAAQDAGQVEELRRAGQKLGREAIAHIKIDTGMTRIGARGGAELAAVLAEAAKGGVRVEGAFTHYCDALDRDFTMRQHGLFLEAVKAIHAAGHEGILAHSAASEASLLYPECRDGGVRPGIVLYGGCQELLPGLKWAMRLTTRPVRVARIQEGESVGYDRAFTSSRESVIMTVPIGYADGYPRAVGGRGWALVRGRRAPVVGRVCMDMLMLDVTDIPGAGMEDEVVLLGAQGEDAVTPDEMAAWCGTISYEIITGFHQRIARGEF